MAFETEEQRAEIIARVWEDPEYKARLKANPKEALAEMGVNVPENVDLQVLETDANKGYFVLPPEPSSDLSDEELEMVAGGMGAPCCGTTGCGTSSKLQLAATQRLGSSLKADTFLDTSKLTSSFKL